MTFKTNDQTTTWKPIQGATTAPIGYHWESNGKSRFGGEYEQRLVPNADTQPLHYDINAITDDMVAVYAKKTTLGMMDSLKYLINVIEDEAVATGKTYTAEEVAGVFAEIMEEGVKVDDGTPKYKVMVKSPKGTTAITTTSIIDMRTGKPTLTSYAKRRMVESFSNLTDLKQALNWNLNGDESLYKFNWTMHGKEASYGEALIYA